MLEILEHAAGRVFRADVDGEELLWIKEKYLVTGMLKQGNHTTVRFLSETPPDVKGASPDEAMNGEVRGRGKEAHGKGMEMQGRGTEAKSGSGEAHEKGAADRKVSAGNAAAGRKTGGEKTCF